MTDAVVLGGLHLEAVTAEAGGLRHFAFDPANGVASLELRSNKKRRREKAVVGLDKAWAVMDETILQDLLQQTVALFKWEKTQLT